MSLAGLRVMLVEDHGFQRRLGLRLLEAGDMIEALGLARRHRPRLA